jgi:hypothetical protein
MREHMRSASRRRDSRLAQVRKLSLWITGGAAAVSLGLGTAFAHALPGHSSASTSPATPSRGAAAGGSPRAGGSSVSSGSSKLRVHHRGHKLARPQQPPKQPPAAPAAPVVKSGGS